MSKRFESETECGEIGYTFHRARKEKEMGYEVVISYAREDRELAQKLCGRMIEEGVETLTAPRVTDLDEGFAMEIAAMLSAANTLVVLMSANANASGQVLRELELATQNNMEIIPVRLDDEKPTGSVAYFLSDKRWFSMKPGTVDPAETAKGIVQYLLDKKGEKEIAFEKVMATVEEAQANPQKEGVDFKRKTSSAILAMVAIPLFFILIIWLVLSQFDFFGTPSDQEYEAAKQHIIEIQDQRLEEAIRTTLSDHGYIVEGDLSEADLWELTSLKVISADENGRIADAVMTDANLRIAENGLIEIDGVIESLEGLQYAKNLTELMVSGQSIQKIDPIAGLDELVFLNLSGNRISDIQPLTELNRLYVLILDYNDIRDLTALSDLDQVAELNLENNEIIDIAPLGGMRELRHLNLQDNKVRNIRVFREMDRLETLNLAENEVDDVEDLADLTALTWLNLRENGIVDIGGLVDLTKLQWLYVGENEISNISVLLEFEDLIGLGIENNRVQNLDVLDELGEDFGILWIDFGTYDAERELMDTLEEKEITIHVVE